MNNREQVLTEWTSLKEKITNTFNHLKEQAKQDSNPEIQHLQNQLLAKTKEIQVKKEQLQELEKPLLEISNDDDETIDLVTEAKIRQLETELTELNQQADKLRNLLEQVTPNKEKEQELSELREKLHRLNYLANLESDLKGKELDNKLITDQYLARIERAEEKWGNSEKKLEQVRDLLSNNLLTRLTELYKQGKI